jgi:hypothetical protein
MTYEWVRMVYPRANPPAIRQWKLCRDGLSQHCVGNLILGTHHVGWHVFDAKAMPIAVLHPELDAFEAQDAAKLLILLSLKQSEET